MRFDRFKEIAPVFYKGRTVIVLPDSTVAPHAVCFPLHWHDRVEMLFVREGAMTVTVGENVSNAAAGDTVLIAPGQNHCAVTEERSVVYDTFMFELSSLGGAGVQVQNVRDELAAGRLSFCPVVHDDGIAAICAELSALHSRWESSGVFFELGLVYRLFGILSARYLIEECPSPPDDAMRKAIDEVAEHFAEQLSTADMAARCGYSEAYFCRRFRSYAGMPFGIFLRTVRLEEACRRLRAGEHDIRVVAHACGFEDPEYFSRCFKRVYGETPTGFLRRSL